MILPTRLKIGAARLAWRGVVAARRLSGSSGRTVEVARRNLRWALDLDEGIDFAIWLTGAFEPLTQRACRRLIEPGDVVVDIGANMGAHTLPLAQAVGPTGRVLAFEPTAEAYSRLKRNIALNCALAPRIVAEQAMLTSGGSSAPADELYASWPLTDAARTHPLHGGVKQSTRGARAASLDDCLERLRIARIDLVKLDVDGYEPDVIAGARRTLLRDKPSIVLEIAPYVLEERGRTANEVISLLGEFGYDFCDLRGRPFERGLETLIERIYPGASLNILARSARG